ncbi:MAG: hypothetical protein ABI333_09385 [bacterium]
MFKAFAALEQGAELTPFEYDPGPLGKTQVDRVETFPFDKVNEALAHLRSGKARYRVVLSR